MVAIPPDCRLIYWGRKMARDLTALFSSEKMLAIAPIWTQRDSDLLEIVCPLQIDSTVIEGLLFRMTARKTLPDEMITAQIELHSPNDIDGPLARIEWRPLSSHNNKCLGPRELRNRLIEGCHCHPFGLNFKYAEQELRRSRLPIAVPIENSPTNFDTLLGFVKKEFRISNIEWIEVPPWEPRLV